MDESTTPELTPEESLAEAVKDLAPEVRQYLLQGKHAMMASRLAGKYKLTPVQADVLERELVLLLLGTQELDEFVQVLAEDASVAVEVAKTLRDEVESQVVDPLEEQIRQASKPKAETTAGVEQAPMSAAPAPAPVVPPVRQVPPPQVPVPSYVAPPLQSPRYVRSESPVAEAMVAPMMPHAGTPRPHITLGATPAPVAPSETAPTPSPVAPAAPVVAPVAMPAVGEGVAPASAPVPPAPVAPIAPPTPPPAPQAPASYTADPYREPI